MILKTVVLLNSFELATKIYSSFSFFLKFTLLKELEQVEFEKL